MLSLARVALRLVIATAGVSLLLILTQDIQIHPAALASIGTVKGDRADAPEGVESQFIAAEDGKLIEVWRVAQQGAGVLSGQVVMIFHGNGETVENSLPLQRWLAGFGATAYVFDYRGYGRSSGWPSEKGLYLDSEAAMRFAAEREEVALQDILIWGSSIGTGPASYVAGLMQSRIVVLLSPFTSLTEVAAGMPLMGHLSPFLWSRFPVLEHLKSLESACIIIVHGERDVVVPVAHGRRIAHEFKGRSGFSFILSQKAGHNDILTHTQRELIDGITSCLNGL